MKLLNLVCFVLISTGATLAQEIDERLLTKYSTSELEAMIADNPANYKLLDYALDNAVYIGDYNAKVSDLPTISIPSLLTSDVVPTFIELGIVIQDENQYFKIIGQDKVLVVKSTWVLTHEMNKK